MKNPNVIKTLLAAFGTTLLASIAIASEVTRIDLTMTAQDRAELAKPVKTEVHNTEIKVSEDSKQTIHSYVTTGSRGQSSIMFPRKNLKIQSVYKDNEGHSQKLKIAGIEASKIVLSAGSADPLVTKNMAAYRIYGLAGIKTMPTSYSEVTINGVSQGLYMVTPNPDDFLMKEFNADIALRRAYTDALELKEAKKSLSQEQIAEYTAAAQSIFTVVKQLKGTELVAALEKKMNLENYMRLLAVNFLIRNGDYYDELYLLGKKNSAGEIYFEVAPWDFDDSFAAAMHLQQLPLYPNNGRGRRAQDQMLYSFESVLDQAISQDPYLLNKYFEVLGKVVVEITPAEINQVFAEVETMVRPYLSNQNVLSQGLIDAGKVAYTSQGVLNDLHTRRDAINTELPKVYAELVEASKEPNRAKRMGKIRIIAGRLEQRLIRKFTNR